MNSARLLVVAGLVWTGTAVAADPSPSPSSRASARAHRDSVKQRLAIARSVKVTTDVLGVGVGSTLEDAHAKLDHLNDPERPWQERKDRGGKRKALWQLKVTPFASVYAKTDANLRIENITGFLREGEELPFDKIGETEKAPLKSATAIVWDVIRPDRPLIRVVAEGREHKAGVIKIFVVPRVRM